MDRDNVIKGVESCFKMGRLGVENCRELNCPYFENGLRLSCWVDVLADALELLKEQEWHLLTEDADGYLHGLPGEDGQYLMTDGKDIWIDDYVDGMDDGIWLDSGRDIREIRAWMYMPKLPILE